ncbi:MAG TPA: helix-turn-helix domain-containing protein [Patescibacteria group bacterium]|nr:helix-turn-helix domain-containing protein [Patescibacteria group bacterium]
MKPTFRWEATKELSTHLKHNESVVLVGMKRVGISNFLRYFLKTDGFFFVPIDINNLVEAGLYPFWTLTLKRLVDQIIEDGQSDHLKALSKRLFAESIQLQDVFFTFEAVQMIVKELGIEGEHVVLVYMRFDRLSENLTHELFANLQSLKDAGGDGVSFIFTAYRPLGEIAPTVFTTASLSVFARTMYLRPASPADSLILLDSFVSRYEVDLRAKEKQQILEFAGGHAQYLQLALMKYKAVGMDHLADDEEIQSLSEEIYQSLTSEEQEQLAKNKCTSPYLFSSGLVSTTGKLFNSALAHYVAQKHPETVESTEFTRKEQLLFAYMRNNLGSVLERDSIIDAVWPDQAELGVSDWAIDRLISRLRVKLKKTASPYTIHTVVTRGYKMVEDRF